MQRVSSDVKLLKAGGLFSTENISSYLLKYTLVITGTSFVELTLEL